MNTDAHRYNSNSLDGATELQAQGRREHRVHRVKETESNHETDETDESEPADHANTDLATEVPGFTEKRQE